MGTNIETLKNKVIEHLASVDLSKLNMRELKLYVDAVNVANLFTKPDYTETLIQQIADLKNTPNAFGYGGFCADNGKESE